MSNHNIFSELFISAFWGPLIVGLILFLLNKIFSGKNNRKTITFKYIKKVVVKHIIEIKENKRCQHSATPVTNISYHSRDDQTLILIVMGLIFLSFFYAKYQIEAITILLGFSTFILSFVLFTVFFSIRKNIEHDQYWSLYLYTTLFLAFLGYPLMYIALNPIYAPPEIQNMSNVVIDGGLADMLKIFGVRGFGFIVLQALGFLTIAIAMLLQTFSLTFYISAIQLAVSSSRMPIINFLAQATIKFKNPNKMIIFSTILYLISFIFISGVGYEWWYSAANNNMS